MVSYAQNDSHKALSRWLFLVILLVIAMISLGGATRLTNSGLSITEWKPITGALPPLSHEAWLSEFEKYKQIPEFAQENPGMTLKEFEFIYFMEWSHRLLGRLIGLVYALPFFWFLLRGRLPIRRSARYFLILVLIGVQGAIGWWMVHSGLSDNRVDVSQYRLAAHLGLAFIILGLLFWTWLDESEGWQLRSRYPAFHKQALLLTLAVYTQIISGAFVAGTHSGKTFNTWPLMDGKFVPYGYDGLTPWWRNPFENAAAIQFNHRMIAYFILFLAVILFLRSLTHADIRRSVGVLLLVILAQIGIGIWTLLAVAPLSHALVHQFTAILVFLTTLWVLRKCSRGY